MPWKLCSKIEAQLALPPSRHGCNGLKNVEDVKEEIWMVANRILKLRAIRFDDNIILKTASRREKKGEDSYLATEG